MPKKTAKGKPSTPPLKGATGPTPKQAGATGWSDPLKPQQPLVSGKWLLSAIGIVIGLAVLCSYAALCLLFYQGSWQLIFHPSHTVKATPASLGLAYDEVRFDYTETGKPQLSGWWIPAGADAPLRAYTMLILRDGRGSLSDSLSRIQALHALGVNLFVFDYRGFGRSKNLHPSEQRMNQDADAALDYLTSSTRHLPLKSILIYGSGLGVPIAVSTASRHLAISALILENASPDALTLLAADSRTKLLPVRLLTSDRLDASQTVSSLPVKKLFLERGSSPQTKQLFQAAADPKEFSRLAPDDQAAYLDALRRFLDATPQQP